MSPKKYRSSPFRLFGAVSLIPSIAGAALFYLELSFNLILSWLISVNIVTFIIYGYDKVRARTGGLRVPENILHGLVLLGGFAGGLGGMFVFHHKASNKKFKRIFWAIILLEIIGICFWLIIRY
jgi:uncharacterized membrane protein YsdA (DUF1294 family)